MSRIGKKPIPIPSGVSVVIAGDIIAAKGPQGENQLKIHPAVQVIQEKGLLAVSVKNPQVKAERALWGLHRALLANLVQGVFTPFEKKLEMVGVGYRASVQGKKLIVEAGFSHPVELDIPEGVTCTVEKSTINLGSFDKARVGAFAARVRAIRKPEPYKGKGIKYAGEVIRRKAGKAAKTAGAGA
ncbi:50S ribosomal protein L6 [Candidatus Uhrbacteria bacterium]|nr:50S ribosomal protein L6 [Candidatus Uhrbacteria bacterium]